MPALELKVAEKLPPASSTRLRTLLEKPNAVVLRRNHLAQAATGDDPALHVRLRVSAVLAVDITNPPQTSPTSTTERSFAGQGSEVDEDEFADEAAETDEFADNFAKGVEIFIGSEKHSALVLADYDEIASALSLFEAYNRIARYQPAYLRLDQRSLGITYAFRDGLVLGLAGDPQQFRENLEAFFQTVPVMSETNDTRSSPFSVRLPHSSIAYLHELLKSASEWLNQNSYKNILGS
jgi:hypothetical protein